MPSASSRVRPIEPSGWTKKMNAFALDRSHAQPFEASMARTHHFYSGQTMGSGRSDTRGRGRHQ